MNLKWRKFILTLIIGGLVSTICLGSALGQAALNLKGTAAPGASAGDIALMKSQAFPIVKNRLEECAYEGMKVEDQMTEITGAFTRANSKQKLISAYFCGNSGFAQYTLAVFENNKLLRVIVSHYGGKIELANDLNKNGTNEILLSGVEGGASAYYEHMTILDLVDNKPQIYGVYLTLQESCQWVGKDAKFNGLSYKLQVKPGSPPTFFAITESKSCDTNKTTVSQSKVAVRWMQPNFEFLKITVAGATNVPQPTARISTNYNGFNISIQKCEAFSSLAHNMKCIIELKNNNKELKRFYIQYLTFFTTKNVAFRSEYTEFSNNKYNGAFGTDFLPNSTLELEVRLTLPKDTRIITQIRFDQLSYQSGGIVLGNVPITGELEDLNPVVIPEENPQNGGFKIRMRACEAVEMDDHNLQCHITIANMGSTVKEFNLSNGSFNFTGSSGNMVKSNNISFDKQSFYASKDVKVVPFGSSEVYINFTVPTGNIQINYFGYSFSSREFSNGWISRGTFQNVTALGVVKDYKPQKSLPGGIYSTNIQGGRINIQVCEFSASTEITVCRFKIFNYEGEVVKWSAYASDFVGLLQNGIEFQGKQLKVEGGEFQSNINLQLPPNAIIQIEVNFQIPQGPTKFATLTIPYDREKNQLREVPIIQIP